MTDSADVYIVVSFDDELDAQMASDFFDDFHLWSDYGGEIKQLEVKGFYDKSEMKWCCVLPEHAKRYTTTLREMRSGLSDFMKGYRKAQAKFGARMEAHLAACTPAMIGEPIDNSQGAEPKYWVEKVTKSGKITLSPKRPESKCRSCGSDTLPGVRYCSWCQ